MIPQVIANRNIAPIAAAALLVFTAVLPGSAGMSAPEPPEAGTFYGADGETWIVAFDDLPEGLRTGQTWGGAEVVRIDPRLEFAVMETSRPEILERQADMHPKVRYVTPDPPDAVQVDMLPPTKTLNGYADDGYQPNDLLFDEQYGLKQIHAPEAWLHVQGGAEHAVCVPDSGVRFTHRDLAGDRYRGGVDYIRQPPQNFGPQLPPYDDGGHGTHVTGIIAATMDNHLGITGVAQVPYMSVKMLNALGSGTASTMASALAWCGDHGGDVINMSWSISGLTNRKIVADAIDYAHQRGSLLITSSGNTGGGVTFPGTDDRVMAVTCTTVNEELCFFTSTGPEAELAAPGADILSTWHRHDLDVETLSGTSMSSPYVAGAAALVWNHAPELSAGQVRQILVETARESQTGQWEDSWGAGILDVHAAVLAAEATDPAPGRAGEVVFREDFDAGDPNGDWDHTGLWNVHESCRHSRQGDHHLAYNIERLDAPLGGSGAGVVAAPTCDYKTDDRTTGAATLTLDLSGTRQPYLMFRHQFEVSDDPEVMRDEMRVEYSTDQGDHWQVLELWGSWTDPVDQWTREHYPLPGEEGVRIRFHFDSLERPENAPGGWFIDLVEVFEGLE